MQIYKHLSALATALTVLTITSCANNQSKSDIKPQKIQTENQNKKNSVTNFARSSKKVVGNASWYGPGLYGQKTTSGQVLKEGMMTAAHSSLPMGTEVKVTRLDTNESVTVVINDRKPYKEGTIIDLAHGAADALNIDDDGTADVEIEIID